jgi:HK97 gp10 family phage protein
MSGVSAAARAAMKRDTAQIVRNLERYALELKREKKKFLEYAAIPMVRAAEAKAPVGSRIHYRYDGQGKIVAEYHPGNLQRSIRVLDLKKSHDVFVGPKVNKGKASGKFANRARVDAYYAHMVEYGTSQMAARPFMRPAWMAAQHDVKRRVELALRAFTAKYKGT